MIDIEKIKQAALAATKGGWSTKDSLHSSNCHVISNKGAGRGICLARQDKDATYIAAANPSAVLELIARLESAEKAAAKWKDYAGASK